MKWRREMNESVDTLHGVQTSHGEMGEVQAVGHW